jgi:hypothetical protein
MRIFNGQRVKSSVVAFYLLFLLSLCVCADEEIGILSLPLSKDINRADLYFAKVVQKPKAVLVLSPGCNGNGKYLLEDPDWRRFAETHSLSIIGLSFASDEEKLRNGRGYYYPEKGSGRLLLDGISKLFGGEMPILLYGFSGGAHFTSRFVEWKPERVISWCAYSAGWWDEPRQSSVMPPGIVACGEDDERLGSALSYFKQGRKLGKPWLWLGIPNNGHSPNKDVEKFVREYFSSILLEHCLASSSPVGVMVDIDKRDVASKDVLPFVSVTGWIPDVRLVSIWKTLITEAPNE